MASPNHDLEDKKKRDFECDTCGKKLATKFALCKHERTHTPSQYKCEYCGKCYILYCSMKNHIASVHIRAETFECKFCTKILYSKIILKRHIKRRHSKNSENVKEKNYKCDHCAYVTDENGILQRHIRQVHENPGFNCTLCEATFRQTKSLNTHVRRVHYNEDLKNKSCPHQCGYSTSNNDHLRNHINAVHLGLRPFKCDLCEKDFTQKSHLNTHHKNVHLKVEDSRFYCHSCSKYFTSTQKLDEHVIRIHSVAKRYTCEECGYATNTKRYLLRHSFSHKDLSEYPFHCKDCKRRFIFQSDIEAHYKTCNLTEEQKDIQKKNPKYFCDICGSYFIKLSDHKLRIHSSNIRFKCEFCDFGTSSKQTIYRHSFHHKQFNKRPFGCDDCELRFITKAELKMHLPHCANPSK